MSGVDVRVLEDGEAVAQAAADELVRAVEDGGEIALSGGGTPQRAYELAAALRADWSSAGLWFGDDRCVPPDHEHSNYRMVREALVDRVSSPPRVHRIRCELEAAEAARLYDEELAGVTLDLALMGLGPDGHTASLFPNAPELGERERRAIPAEAGMEPFVERVTMTVPLFEEAQSVLFLVVGEEKAEAAARAFAAEPSPSTPASLTRSRTGRTLALLDPAAAALLR